MDNLNMDEKEKEIAATNRLLNIIRGEQKTEKNEFSVVSETDSQNRSSDPLNPDVQKENRKQETAEPAPIINHDQKYQETNSQEIPQGRPSKKPDLNQSFSIEQKSYGPPEKHRVEKQKKMWHKWLKRHDKKAIGLDIGSHSLKYVLLQKGMGGLRVLDYKIVELPDGKEESGNKKFTKNLKTLLTSTNLINTKIVSSVSGPSVIVRHVQFPPMTQKEFIQSLKWEAKSYIPFPLNEVNLDYQILPRRNGTQGLDVILVAVTKKTLNDHLQLLKSVSIEPDIVDIDPLVFINTYLTLQSEKEPKTVILIYIGAQSCVLSIYRHGGLFFTRDINIAGNAFTKKIQSQWNISYVQAEAIKRGNIPEDISLVKRDNLQTILRPVTNELINEVRRSLVYYDNQTGKKGFSNIVLTGGGSLLRGLPEHLSSELGLDVDFLDPFKRLHVTMDESDHPELSIKEQAERLSLSVGLAFRGTTI